MILPNTDFSLSNNNYNKNKNKNKNNSKSSSSSSSSSSTNKIIARWSPSGQYLFTSDHSSFRIWDVRTWEYKIWKIQ